MWDANQYQQEYFEKRQAQPIDRVAKNGSRASS